MTVHRSFKTNSNSNKIQNYVYSQSNDTNQNSAYTTQTKSSVETNSNIPFVSSKHHYETTQDYHKRKKKTTKFVYTFLIKYFNSDFVQLPLYSCDSLWIDYSFNYCRRSSLCSFNQIKSEKENYT